MDEPLYDRLERRIRFWRNLSLVLAAALLSVVATSVSFFGVYHRPAMGAAEAAAQAERAARQQAEITRLQAERALQQAGERKKD
jgi:hypothetical protein